jgi:hypothetical protein
MRRTAVLIASAAINASTIPAVAAEYTSNKDIDASRARWATVFQIFTASPLPSSCRLLENSSDADGSGGSASGATVARPPTKGAYDEYQVRVA